MIYYSQVNLGCLPLKETIQCKQRIHGRAEIWNFSSSVHIDSEQVSEANEWDIECEHEKINSKSPRVHVLFCLLCKHTNNDVFDDFLKISTTFRRFLKLFQRLVQRLRTFSEDYRRLPKEAEDFRGSTDDVSIMQHHLRVLFKRLCTYSNGNLKTCDNNLIFSHLKLS